MSKASRLLEVVEPSVKGLTKKEFKQVEEFMKLAPDSILYNGKNKTRYNVNCFLRRTHAS